MATILPDRTVRELLGSVLLDADLHRINPNGIELRLGSSVRFHSTGETKSIGKGEFLRVQPGETVIITSLEKIDFSPEVVGKAFPGCGMMGLITPTTTMMREGISQVTTKIDSGFRGVLNWALRNGSTNDLLLEYAEPIFKLTILLLTEGEVPEIPYGQRAADQYQDSIGIVDSKRRVPAQVPKDKVISSSFDRLDPKKRLQEAGYPFSHIGSELVELQGKFEIVSADVRLLKDEFKRTTDELSAKIGEETKAISSRLDVLNRTFLDKIEQVFQKKFMWVVGAIVGAVPVMYSGVVFLSQQNVEKNLLAFIALVVGLLVLLVTYGLARKGR
jgi:deoxycytidine triphosphate deaminase